MFIGENSSVRILTVMECSWGAKNRVVKGRRFSALSLRLLGNSEITEGGKTEQMKTGDILYMPAGAGYRLNCRDEHIIVIHFDVEGDHSPHAEVFRPQNSLEIREAFSELLSVWSDRREGYYFRALSVFYKIIYALIGAKGGENEKYLKIREAVELMHEKYTDPDFEVHTLWERSYMSDTYFRRIFFELYGKKPLQYLNDLRISHAKVLLSENDFTVCEVALRSGFSSVKYFSSAFRARLGISPSEYKKGRTGCEL